MTALQATDQRPTGRGATAVSPGPAPAGRLSGHLPALDGIRGLAILLVLLFHCTQDVPTSSPFARAAVGLASIGWCGVDLFFVLSGFLITGILHDSKASANRSRNFYARRALRIFPLYYGLLAIIITIAPMVLAPSDARLSRLESIRPWLLVYGTNIRIAFSDHWCFLGHFWSLAVEEHFYLVWPAVIFWSTRKSALRICGGIVLAALACRAGFLARGAVLAPYCLTVCRMDSLAIGSFLALAARGEGGLEALAPLARRVALASGLVLLPLLSCWPEPVDAPTQLIGFPLLDLFFASLLVLTVTAPCGAPLSALFRHRSLRTLGKYSYGLYVFNSIILNDVFPIVLPQARLTSWSGSSGLALLIHAVLSFSATLVTAWLSWHLYEVHFLKLKRYFSDDRPLHARATA